MLVLEVGGGFKAGNSSDVSMGRAEFLFELSMEVFPVNKSMIIQTLFFPKEHSTAHFSVLPVFIEEAVRTQTDVSLAGAMEGHSASTISIELQEIHSGNNIVYFEDKNLTLDGLLINSRLHSKLIELYAQPHMHFTTHWMPVSRI